MIGIRLRTDQRPVESNTNLFEDGVSYVVDQIGSVCGHCIASRCFLKSPFYFKVTAREIDKNLLEDRSENRSG